MTTVADAPVRPFQLGCPPELAPLHGILAPRTAFERMEASARSQELTDRIDEISWDAWLAGDTSLVPTREVDSCGCEIRHWRGADNLKSVTLHDGCAKSGYGAHIWSGTMIGLLQLGGDHLSRLQLSAAVRGISEREAAAAVGIELGGGREELAPVRPEHYDHDAEMLDRMGQPARAAVMRQAAVAFRNLYPELADNSQIGLHSRIAGGVPPPPKRPEELPAAAAETGPPRPLAPAAVPSLGVGPDSASEHPRTQPNSEGDCAANPNTREIRRFPNTAFAQMPTPAKDEIYEYPFPPTPAHVTAVHGARTAFADMLPPLANRQLADTVEHEWIFSATPGLSQVAAAADAHGLSRWGMLGALLPRVAAHIPATVRLVPAGAAMPDDNTPTASGTSLNLYSVLVGPPASGKSVTLAAADALVPNVRMIPPGTGEGILKLFPQAGGGDGESAEHADLPAIGGVDDGYDLESLLLSSDEIDVFVGEMARQGSKTTAYYRSMWMGGDIGNVTSARERHSMVAAHTYRFGIRLGAQPETVAALFDEGGRGTPQRFLWLGAQRMPARGGRYPERLAIAPVYWFGGAPSMLPATGEPHPPVWIIPPPAARQYMKDEEWRSATANPLSPSGGYDEDAAEPRDLAESITQSHAVLQRLKISAVLAVLDGLNQPQDTHWFASEAIMEVRKRVVRELVAVAEATHLTRAIKQAREHGKMRVHADAAGGAELQERTADARAAVLVAADNLNGRGEPITHMSMLAEVMVLGGNCDFIPEAIRGLIRDGFLTMNSDGVSYSTSPPEGVERPRTVRVVHGAPAASPTAAPGVVPLIRTVGR